MTPRHPNASFCSIWLRFNDIIDDSRFCIDREDRTITVCASDIQIAPAHMLTAFYRGFVFRNTNTMIDNEFIYNGQDEHHNQYFQHYSGWRLIVFND